MTKPKEKAPPTRPVKELAQDISKRKAALKQAYDRALAILNMDLKDLQATCKHDRFSFHGDAAGGNDSFHSCDDCGHQW